MFGTHVITAIITLFAALSLQVCSRTLLAQTPDPQNPSAPIETPTPDPDGIDKTIVVCGGNMTFNSNEFGATRDSNTGNVFHLTAVPGAPDKRTQTSGVIKLANNHEFQFVLTWIPNASQLVHGEDLISATVRYQRREGSGVKVLAESVLTSDQMRSFSELVGRRTDLPLQASFNNPEVATIKANRGVIPDGITTTGSFNCSMHVGRSTDLR